MYKIVYDIAIERKKVDFKLYHNVKNFVHEKNH